MRVRTEIRDGGSVEIHDYLEDEEPDPARTIRIEIRKGVADLRDTGHGEEPMDLVIADRDGEEGPQMSAWEIGGRTEGVERRKILVVIEDSACQDVDIGEGDEAVLVQICDYDGPFVEAHRSEERVAA